jgi:hypothetical protein
MFLKYFNNEYRMPQAINNSCIVDMQYIVGFIHGIIAVCFSLLDWYLVLVVLGVLFSELQPALCEINEALKAH